MNPKSPPVVAFVRGLILAVVGTGASTAVIYASSNGDTIKQYWWAPFVLVALRSIEGAVDKLRGQADQQGVLGGKPANPADYTQAGVALLDLLIGGAFVLGALMVMVSVSVVVGALLLAAEVGIVTVLVVLAAGRRALERALRGETRERLRHLA